jgi:hypothetical protein
MISHNVLSNFLVCIHKTVKTIRILNNIFSKVAILQMRREFISI